ncbi:MAG: Ser-Thr-rich GPI-anchored membrane family protein [Thermoplasmata archaeon]
MYYKNFNKGAKVLVWMIVFIEISMLTISSMPSNAEAVTITVTSPTKDLMWQTGTTQNITWNSTGDVGNYVKIELDYDIYSAPTVIATNVPNNGCYSWQIPSTLASRINYFIRIKSVTVSHVYDDSPYFAITNTNSITITSPTKNSMWLTDTTQNITWTSSGDIGNYVKIEFDYDIYTTPTVITSTAPNNGCYSWRIPSTLASRINYFIRIKSVAASSIYADSPYFAITNPSSIIITSPTKNSTWQTGTTQNITWNSTGDIGNYVKIEVDYNIYTTPTVIASTALNNGSYSWQIPSTLASRINYFIRIKSVSISSIYADSPYFAITNPSSIIITSPTKNTTWFKETTQNITWNSTGDLGNYVNIEYDYDIYTTPTVIVSIAPNNGHYSWQIPSTLPSRINYFIRIKSVTVSSICGDSQYFAITDMPPNHAPTITNISTNITTINISTNIAVIKTGEQAIVTVTAIDADNDTLTYSYSATGGAIVGNGSVAVWTAPTTNGTYTITATVRDWSLVATATVSITAVNGTTVNSATNQAPTITNIFTNRTTVNLGEQAIITVIASDADGGTLAYSYSLTNGTISGNDSIVTWTAPTTSGTYPITVTVSDGFLSATSSINVTVVNTSTNNPPIFSISSEFSGNVKDAISITGTASDDTLVQQVEIKMDDGNWTIVTGTTAMVSKSWAYPLDTTNLSEGKHTIKVRAYDGIQYSNETALDITVANNASSVINDLPTVLISSQFSGKVKGTISINGTASDDVLVQQVEIKIDNGNWTIVTGTTAMVSKSWSYSLNTTNLSEGKHTIRVRVYDGTQYSNETASEITIENVKKEEKQIGFISGFDAILAAIGVSIVVLMRRRHINKHN